MTKPAVRLFLVDLIGRVRAGWPGTKWEWDPRLDCALSTVAKAQEEKAKALLAAGLPAVWNEVSLPEAPAPVRQACALSGGLRGGQAAFSVDLADGSNAYSLWWPWNSGATFSARVGALSTDGDEELILVVRSAFGIK